MQINLLLWPFGELAAEIKKCPDLQKLMGSGSGRMELNWPSKDFTMLRTIWHQVPYVDARTEFVFPDSWTSDAKLFEVWNQTTGYAVTDADRQYIFDQEKSGPVLYPGPPVVRFFSEVRLTKPKTKARQISGLDASASVFLIDAAEVAEWKKQAFTGLEFGPVYGHRTTVASEEAFLLMPRHVMAASISGPNIVVSRLGQDEHHHVVGFSVYEPSAINSALDFNFTREPTCSFGYPKILVSRRFHDFYKSRGLKGWCMRPVIERGSLAHQEFMATLEKFLADWNTGNPKNRLIGP